MNNLSFVELEEMLLNYFVSDKVYFSNIYITSNFNRFSIIYREKLKYVQDVYDNKTRTFMVCHGSFNFTNNSITTRDLKIKIIKNEKCIEQLYNGIYIIYKTSQLFEIITTALAQFAAYIETKVIENEIDSI